MLALLLMCADVASAQVIDRIMAVVGGRPIILSDVHAAIQFRLIERFQPPEPDPIEITVRVDDLQRRAGSAEAFDTALSVTGMTREQLRRHIRDDLRITTYLNQRFGSTMADRAAAVATWVSELRRRADVTILYRGL